MILGIIIFVVAIASAIAFRYSQGKGKAPSNPPANIRVAAGAKQQRDETIEAPSKKDRAKKIGSLIPRILGWAFVIVLGFYIVSCSVKNVKTAIQTDNAQMSHTYTATPSVFEHNIWWITTENTKRIEPGCTRVTWKRLNDKPFTVRYKTAKGIEGSVVYTWPDDSHLSIPGCKEWIQFETAGEDSVHLELITVR